MFFITIPRIIFVLLLASFMYWVNYSIIIIVVTSAVYLILMALLRKYFDGGVNIHYPKLDGKIIIITGANSGMGEASV